MKLSILLLREEVKRKEKEMMMMMMKMRGVEKLEEGVRRKEMENSQLLIHPVCLQAVWRG